MKTEPEEVGEKRNIRYELFKDFAKENNTKICKIEYMKFIDNMGAEYERIHNRPCLSNQNEFDNFIKYKVLAQIAENTARRDIGIGNLQSSSFMNKLLEKYNISEKTVKEDQGLLKRIEFSWERGNREKIIKQYDEMLEKLPEKYKNKYYEYLKFKGEEGTFQNFRELSYKKDILNNIDKIEKVDSKVKIFIYWTDENEIKIFKENTAYSLERANSLAQKSFEQLKQTREKIQMPYISNDIKFSIIIDDEKNFQISKPDDFVLGSEKAKDFYELIEYHYGIDMINEIKETEKNEEEEESL